MSKTYLTKADFLAGITLQPQDLEVEGLGVVQVRGLGLMELDEVDAKSNERQFLMMIHAAHKGLVNPQLSIEDLEAVGHGNSEIVVAIGKRVFELSARGDRKETDPLPGGGLPSNPT